MGAGFKLPVVLINALAVAVHGRSQNLNYGVAGRVFSRKQAHRGRFIGKKGILRECSAQKNGKATRFSPWLPNDGGAGEPMALYGLREI
jgi:hypothetical protein